MSQEDDPGEREPERTPASAEPQPQFRVENSGEPIHLRDLNLAGVAAEAAVAGDKVKYWSVTFPGASTCLTHHVM